MHALACLKVFVIMHCRVLLFHLLIVCWWEWVLNSEDVAEYLWWKFVCCFFTPSFHWLIVSSMKHVSFPLIAEAMIKGLTRVPWERVDISFQKSIQKVFAHCTIQVFYFLFVFVKHINNWFHFTNIYCLPLFSSGNCSLF